MPLFLLLTAALAGACSNEKTKKKPVGTDAATGDGSSAGGGTGGAEAGLDAAPDVTADSAPDVTADAMPDVVDAAPDVADAGCGPGTVNLVAGGCLACPADAGAADSGTTSEAGVDAGDPFNPILTCQMLANTTTSFDPGASTLTLKADFPLLLDAVYYDIEVGIMSATGGVTFQTLTPAQPTVPLVNNTLTLDLSSLASSGQTVVSVTVQDIKMFHACGAVEYQHFDCQNQPDELLLDPADAGAWTPACGPNC